jgi:hypothetical protein
VGATTQEKFKVLPSRVKIQGLALIFSEMGSPSLCIKMMHTIQPSFISIIQQKPAESLTSILQTEATKQRCQSTTKLVQS